VTDYRKSGLALIAGSLGGLITMMLHPTARDLMVPGEFDAVVRLNVAVHSLALISVPVLFLGALGLTRYLGSPSRLSLAALVIYGYGCMAVMNAGAFSGFIAPGVLRQIAAASGGSQDAWRVALHYTGDLNQAFARMFVVASSVSVLLWSLDWMRFGRLGSALGMYGCLVGIVVPLALLTDHVRLNVHGFGAIVVVQSIWLITAGTFLCRVPEAR